LPSSASRSTILGSITGGVRRGIATGLDD
jgi:hypothetical protein